MSLMKIVEKVRSFRNAQVIEPAPAPTSPIAYPYAHERGFSHCYLTHEYTSRRVNGADIRYFMVQDVYSLQYRWISEKALIVNSWFTMRDGVL